MFALTRIVARLTLALEFCEIRRGLEIQSTRGKRKRAVTSYFIHSEIWKNRKQYHSANGSPVRLAKRAR